MKRRLFIVAVLIIGLIACLASCKKKTVEPTPEEPTPYVPSEDDITCHHDSLLHVLPVEPTEFENGRIEHYVCYECLATFADAEGKTPISNTILWANSLVIDDDNIIENNFCDYAGDTSYMFKANLESAAGLGNIGTLWDDYTDWEYWTPEEWEAYWDKMHEYYIEWGGEMQFDELGDNSVIASIFSIFLSRIINKCLDNIDKNIAMFFDENNVVNKKLDQILTKLDNIQEDIKKLSDKMTLQQYKTVMQNRYEKQVPLETATTSIFREVLRLMEKEKKSFSELPEDVLYQIKDLSNQWHNQTVAGNNIETTFQSMLVFAGGDFITGQKLPAVYDFIAASSSPWEHQGYVFREMTRATDVVLMAECYLMAIIYHKTHPGQFFDQTLLNNKMMGYVEILNAVPIEYHNDRYICSIPGAEIQLDRELLAINPHKYVSDHANKDLYMSDYNSVEAFLHGMNDTEYVDQSWFKTVYEYYQAKRPTHLHDILLHIGYKNAHTFNHIIAGSKNGYVSRKSYRTNRCFRWNSIFGHTGDDYLSFTTAIDSKCNSYGILIATSMNIRHKDNFVTDAGKKKDYTYCTLKRK